MKNYILTFILLIGVIFTIPTMACDQCDVEWKEDDSFFKMNHSLILNANYQSIKSEHTKNLGRSEGSITKYRADIFSNFEFGEKFGITSTLRAINIDFESDFKNRYGFEDPDHDRIPNMGYTDVHFRSLYLTYKFPEVNGYKHMVAGGTMPFQGGAWKNYKIGGIQEADGLSMMFNMPFDALIYVADFSDMIDYDFLQVRIGHGDHMKFRDLYPQSEDLATIADPFKSKVSYVNFDFKDGPHNLKIEYYKTDWVFDGTPVGSTQHYGTGYAFDKLNENNGYVIYGTVSYMEAKGDFEPKLVQSLEENKDLLVAGLVQQYGLDPRSASIIIEHNLSNPTDEFLSSATGLYISDMGLLNSYYGWAYQIGAKKEFWIEEYDIDWFIGAEYFRGSKHWVTDTFRGFPNSGTNTLTKGHSIDLYTGIKFNESLILTLSWVHDKSDYAASAINYVVGVDETETNRPTHKNRDTFMIDFTWLFMGL